MLEKGWTVNTDSRKKENREFSRADNSIEKDMIKNM
jgi:hypothetical protein